MPVMRHCALLSMITQLDKVFSETKSLCCSTSLPSLLCSNESISFFLVVLKDVAKRKSLLSNSDVAVKREFVMIISLA